MRRILLAAAVTVACIAPTSGAEKNHRHHGAHEHGAAELKLVWEKNVVTIELESPAVNIVGFEHKPRTAAQKKAVQDALTVLRDTDRLFSFTAEAACRGEATAVESELASQTDKHDHGKKKGGAEEHSEFHANYRFTCDKPDALKTVDVSLFKLFPKMRKLRAQVVSPRGQSATELKPGGARLSLR